RAHRARPRRTRRGWPEDSIPAPIRGPRLAASSEDHPPTRRMWDDHSERDSTGDGLERCVKRIRRDRDDEPDPHVPGVEPLYRLAVSEVREKREEGGDHPRLAIDPCNQAFRQRAREVAFQSSAEQLDD